MGNPPDLGVSHRKERKHRRFDLQFPVCLSFHSASVLREVAGVSRNVSVGGLLLKVSDLVPLRTKVSLTIAVQDPRLCRPVRLLGKGEVVRAERLECDSGFAIAIECRHPITEIESHLPATG
jgi:hypothetical protein